MRSLDEFYKYIDEKEQELRARSETTPEPGRFQEEAAPVAADPPATVSPPAAPESAPVTVVPEEKRENRETVVPQTPGLPQRPGRTKPAAEGFVPPPLPPRPARPSRYERIVPAEVLHPNAKPGAAAPARDLAQNGHVAPPLPPSEGARPPSGGMRYTMHGGMTIPIPQEAGPAMPDIETYIPTLRDTPAQKPSPESAPSASPQKRHDENGARHRSAPGDGVQDYLPPIVENQEPPLVADAPLRARRARRSTTPAAAAGAPELSDGEAAALWGRLPRHIQLLVGMSEPQEEVAQKYYTRGFKESRRQLIERLLDPTLTLEDTARVLGVCPTTVRRYTNRGLLPHHRTVGQQRRFRLSDVLGFLERQSARGGSSDLATDAGQEEGDVDA